MNDFRIEPTATRYHFEVVNGKDLSLAVYLKGHKAPDMFDYLPDLRLLDVLKVLEQAGFAVRIYDHGSTAVALKDQPTRIDFLKEGDNWLCKKYAAGWTASTPPIETKQMTEQQIAEAIQWCKDRNWIVREFPGGARAWKGKLLPVRDRAAILSMARKIKQSNLSRPDNRRLFDFAFDC
jgi:hypothetical protein